MAHQTLRTGYEQLVERLNRFPQGAPPSDLLYAILKLLFTEKEAGLVSLQNLIFDNQALASHRAMAAILGVILRLPPARQIMASEQMKSKYLVALLNRLSL